MGKRQIERLSALQVKRAKNPGMLADGGGLYLQIGPTGGKAWIFRYALRGKARWMGLGSVHTIGLAEARVRAQEKRTLLLDGIDPLEAKGEQRAALALAAAKSVTFAQCAAKYIDAHRTGWKNAKHVDQWTNTLATYAEPVIGALPVQAVDTALVMKVLEPIWYDKAETASRLRGRIESILDWAKVSGYRTGDNPARWRGHLDHLLPARSKVQKVQHHAALPYDEMGEFMTQLREQEGIAALALQFLILTAARTGEAIGAQWREFDLDAKLWTVPAERMKAKKEHRVPLSPRAVKLLEELAKIRVGEYVFPGRQAARPLSNMAMLQLLKRMGRANLTAHGFRSSFRDWAAESTNFPREVAEAALAHTLGDKVEAAYRRGDLFEKRRLLMTAWAKHCQHVEKAGNVLPMTRRKG
jgi:integrase